MPPTFEPRATFHRVAPRAVRELSHEHGLLLVLLRGTGILVSGTTNRILASGDSVQWTDGGKATFTASAHGSGVELLELRQQRSAEAQRTAAGPPAPTRDRRIREALRLMQSELQRPWTVAELARKVGLSRAAFARTFKDATSASPRKHLAELRLTRASDLLTASDLGLAEIAEHVGYRSEFAFNRAFKRRYGIAPGTFRRRSRSTSPCLAIAA